MLVPSRQKTLKTPEEEYISIEATRDLCVATEEIYSSARVLHEFAY
jgi:hypothetical protein